MLYRRWCDHRDAALQAVAAHGEAEAAEHFSRMREIEQAAAVEPVPAVERLRLALAILEHEHADTSAMAVLRRLQADLEGEAPAAAA